MHGVIKKRPAQGQTDRLLMVQNLNRNCCNIKLKVIRIIIVLKSFTEAHIPKNICVSYLERNCTMTHTAAYISPLISHESTSRSAINPTNQITTKGVNNINFCRNSYTNTNTDLESLHLVQA